MLQDPNAVCCFFFVRNPDGEGDKTIATARKTVLPRRAKKGRPDPRKENLKTVIKFQTTSAKRCVPRFAVHRLRSKRFALLNTGTYSLSFDRVLTARELGRAQKVKFPSPPTPYTLPPRPFVFCARPNSRAVKIRKQRIPAFINAKRLLRRLHSARRLAPVDPLLVCGNRAALLRIRKTTGGGGGGGGECSTLLGNSVRTALWLESL